MRSLITAVVASAVTAAPVLAQEAEHAPVNLLAPNAGLMFWTLVIF